MLFIYVKTRIIKKTKKNKLGQSYAKLISS